MNANRTEVRYRVDRGWFLNQLHSLGLKQRHFVEIVLGRNASQGTMFMKGVRPLKGEEIERAARLLQVSTDEILARSGATAASRRRPLNGTVASSGRAQRVVVKGWVDDAFMVHRKTPPTGNKVVDSPLPKRPDLLALRVATGRDQEVSMVSRAYRGAVLFFYESAIVDPEAIGQPSLVKLSKSPKERIRIVEAGGAPGEYNLLALDGSPILGEQSVRLRSAARLRAVSYE
jgi:hypothetical protein